MARSDTRSGNRIGRDHNPIGDLTGYTNNFHGAVGRRQATSQNG